MVKNKNNKLVNIRTILKELERDSKKGPKYKSPSLNDIIERTTNDSNIMNSFYDKNFNSDIPDPFRKKRNK